MKEFIKKGYKRIKLIFLFITVKKLKFYAIIGFFKPIFFFFKYLLHIYDARQFSPSNVKENLRLLHRIKYNPSIWLECTSKGELREKTTFLSKCLFSIKNILLFGAPISRIRKVIDLTFLSFCIEIYNPFSRAILKEYLKRKKEFILRWMNPPSRIDGYSLNFKNILYHLDLYIRNSLLQDKMILWMEKAVLRAKEPIVVQEIKKALIKGISPLLITVGISGSYWMRGPDKKIYGIFKPFDEEINAPNNPIGPNLQGALGQRRAREGLRVGESAHREVAAFLVDQYFGLGIVPKTYYASFSHSIFYQAHEDLYGKRAIKKKYGSFQEYVEGFVPIHKTLKEETKKIPLDEYQLLVVFDVIIGNCDRNTNNFLVAEDKIAAIDHGLSFPDLPGHVMSWYWENLEQGKQPFYPEIKKIITEFPYEDLFWKLRKNCFLSPNALHRMRERVALLRAGIEKNLTPFEMSELMRLPYLEPLYELDQTLDDKAKEMLEKYLAENKNRNDKHI
jgi:hypothetical protein